MQNGERMVHNKGNEWEYPSSFLVRKLRFCDFKFQVSKLRLWKLLVALSSDYGFRKEKTIIEWLKDKIC